MAAIVWADVTAWAPSLSTVHATVQSDAVAFANAAINVSLFTGGESSARLRLARIMLAAHRASLPKLGLGAAGPTISRSGGGLSETFAGVSSFELGMTAYGQQLKSLIRAVAGGPWGSWS